ncbi:MAG: hypothetical protein OXS50_06090 [Gammaproteobacteria bacterium]|nr:hypothetical protein [Gammaproteobacteria bacterium]
MTNRTPPSHGRNAGYAAVAFLAGVLATLAVMQMAPTKLAEPAPAAPHAPAPASPAAPRPPQTATPLALADIAAIGNDFERNTRLYALAKDADRRRIEELLAAARNLPTSFWRNDISRLLYVRFASIDPEAAVAHVLDGLHQPSWLATVFRAWAHADFDAALERAATLEPEDRAIAAQSLLEMDLAPWQRQQIAEQLDAQRILAQVLTREDLAFGTPEQAWTRALSAPADGARNRLLNNAGRAWARANPQAALEAALAVALDDGERLPLLADGILSDWVESDPASAFEWLAHQDAGPYSEWLASTAVRTLAKDNMDAALLSLDDLPAWAREPALRGLLSVWAKTDLSAAVEWFDTLPAAEQRDLGWSITNAFAAHDVDAAFDWAITRDARIREHFLGPVIGAVTDRAEAARLVRQIDDPDLLDRALFWLSNHHTPADPREALRWADTFESRARDHIRAKVFRDWAKDDPAGAAAEVNRQRTTELRDQTAVSVIPGLLTGLHTEAAERLFETIILPPERCRAAGFLHTYFVRTDAVPEKAALYHAILNACTGGGGDG